MNKGVTLVELILVIAIFAVILGASAPLLSSFYYRFQYITTVQQTQSLLRVAQTQSMGIHNDSQHGLFIDSSGSQLVLFQGIDYASRDTDYDLVVDYDANVVVTTTYGDEITFEKLSGNPSVTGTITVSSDAGSANVTINDEGLVD